jgi:molybdate transport system ATP-binding protein
LARAPSAPQQRGIGFVFQDYALFHLTVEGTSVTACSTPARAARPEMLNHFDLVDVAQRPRQLSVASNSACPRALVRRPRLLLLDEPLSALDTALREELRGGLRRMLTECGIPVFLVTHDRAEALALGDELVVMSGGAMRQSGPVLEVFNRPANADVARIVRVETVNRAASSVNDGWPVAVGATQITRSHRPASPPMCSYASGRDVILTRRRTASSVRTSRRPRISVLPDSC